MHVLALLALCVAAVAAVPSSSSRLSGGNLVTIDKYPSSASIFQTWDGIHLTFTCAGTIINNRSILTAGFCVYYLPPPEYRVRVGSSYAYTGGDVLSIATVILYPDYNDANFDDDIAIVQTSVAITLSDYVRPAPMPESNYNLGDNQAVWATGWSTAESNADDDQITEIEVFTVNNDLCKSRYADYDAEVTDDVLCTGWPQQDYSGQCGGIGGAGVYQSGVLVGVSTQCFDSKPTINTRVSKFTSWIQANA